MCFRNHFFINLIAHTLTLRARDCQFDNFVVAGGTVSCHYDKLRCHQWWRGCRVDDLLFTEYDIALYILALFICRILAFWLMLFVVHTTLNKFYLILSYFIIGVQNHSSFSIFRKYSQFSIDIKRKWRSTFRSAHCHVGSSNENIMTLKRSLHYWTLCVVKPPSTGGSPHKAPVGQSFHIIFNVSLKMLNKQSRYRTFETQRHPCHITVII